MFWQLSTTSWIMAVTKDDVKLNLSIPPSHYLGWTNLLCLYLTESLRKMSQRISAMSGQCSCLRWRIPLVSPQFFLFVLLKCHSKRLEDVSKLRVFRGSVIRRTLLQAGTLGESENSANFFNFCPRARLDVSTFFQRFMKVGLYSWYCGIVEGLSL